MSVPVLKIGGAALADGDWLGTFAGHVLRAGPCVIVHGGGPDISAVSERLGIPVEWRNGRRITTPEGLDAASMVLSGRVNKRIVAALLDAGVDALGLSGEDGALVTADPAGKGLGRVGHVAAVRTELLHWLLEGGMVPVVSPISRSPGGVPLNVNADEAAAGIAAALRSPELLFVTDVEGVRDAAGVRRSELTVEGARDLLATGAARGGMAVKLEAALSALRRVAAVRIGRFETMHDADAGTRIRAEREVALW